jgi:hypothetical protein
VYERVLPIGFPGFVKSKTLTWTKMKTNDPIEYESAGTIISSGS